MDWSVADLLCFEYKRTNLVSIIISDSSLAKLHLSLSTVILIQDSFQQANRIERYTFVDGRRSEKNPAPKDSQSYWACVPTYLCGYVWHTHSRRKAESLQRLRHS